MANNMRGKMMNGHLTAAARKSMPASEFGLPAERKYPMPDRSHAANAKARAAQQRKKGNISAAQEKQIDAKANRVLGEKSKKKRSK